MGFKYMMADLPRERVMVGVEYIGAALFALEKTIEYVKTGFCSAAKRTQPLSPVRNLTTNQIVHPLSTHF